MAIFCVIKDNDKKFDCNVDVDFQYNPIDEYKGSRIKWRDTEEDEDILCSDSSPCEYQTDEDGEPLADEVSGKESIVIEDDSVRGES